MPPSVWGRWTGRGRSSESTQPPVPPPPEPEETAYDRLFDLADDQATGALYLNGRWGGTVYLVNGRIGYVESVLTPGIEALLLRPTYTDERSWARLVSSLRRGRIDAAVSAASQLLGGEATSAFDAEVLRRTALADAALVTLGAVVPDATGAVARFRPGAWHWCEPVRTFSVAEVLTEVERRKAVLARMTRGVRMDAPIQRAPQLPVERIRLTATQWNIAALANGTTTPLDIAWMLGHGVFATTVAIHQLARLGVIKAGPAPTSTVTVPPSAVPPTSIPVPGTAVTSPNGIRTGVGAPSPARHVPSFLPSRPLRIDLDAVEARPAGSVGSVGSGHASV
ncbi:hypothetical protein LWF15_34485 [Kineosporia rhizophila]|uniref:hypothetical protein n=1 Tax=Kineosporia TaxID=49184 RepID=UPI001E623898|nr:MULTISPECIES: hypothetical protein [Kineosporia]MCE0540615.1 hypothetical protein [Kineosporia rhizophila]GLY14114.1 hypothetical protein Kisp01_11300 [Kineosporia sp. NBRC 101677]